MFVINASKTAELCAAHSWNSCIYNFMKCSSPAALPTAPFQNSLKERHKKPHLWENKHTLWSVWNKVKDTSFNVLNRAKPSRCFVKHIIPELERKHKLQITNFLPRRYLYQHGAHSGLQLPWLPEGLCSTTSSRNKWSHIGLSRTSTSVQSPWVFITKTGIPFLCFFFF